MVPDVGIWLAALVATGLTVWYSLGPTPPSHGSDKDLHVAAYFVDAFAILLAVVWRPGRETRRLKAGMLPVALGLLSLGGVIEIAQGGFVDRDAQFGDWVADAAGIGPRRLDLRPWFGCVSARTSERHRAIAPSTRPPIGPRAHLRAAERAYRRSSWRCPGMMSGRSRTGRYVCCVPGGGLLIDVERTRELLPAERHELESALGNRGHQDDGEIAGFQEPSNLASELNLDELDEALAADLHERLEGLERAETDLRPLDRER